MSINTIPLLTEKSICRTVITAVHYLTDYKHENISYETKFVDDLGMDSLDMVELIIKIEDDLDIDINDVYDDKFKVLKTVGGVINFIKKYENI